MNLPRKMGRVEISIELIEKAPVEFMTHIMSKLIVMRAEFIYYKGIIEYYAYSEDFRKLEEMESIPQYNILVTSKHELDKRIIDKVEFTEVGRC